MWLLPAVRYGRGGLLEAGDGDVAGDLGDEALEHFARTELDELGGAVGDHVADGLGPAYRSGELGHEVGLDLGGRGVGECVDVLVNGADGGVDLGGLDGGGEAGACRLHEGGVEGSAYLEGECALGAGGLGCFAGCGDGFDLAGDDDLAGAVVVGSDDDAGSGGADLLYLLVGERYDGCHGGGMELAGVLHGLGALGHEAQAVGEAEGSGGGEGGELAQGVAGYHVGTEVSAEGGGEHHGVEEDGGLGDARLAEILVGAGKHEVGDAESEYVVGLVEELACAGIAVVEVFAHAGELCALAGEYECFHVGCVD